jgi:Domain of unknown function (DUF4346)
MTAISRKLVSRFDHAAYLGRELARSEHALTSGEHHVQDAPLEAASVRNVVALTTRDQTDRPTNAPSQ